MDTNTIIFTIISVAIIAFNTYIFYTSSKDLKRRRQEPRGYQEKCDALSFPNA